MVKSALRASLLPATSEQSDQAAAAVPLTGKWTAQKSFPD